MNYLNKKFAKTEAGDICYFSDLSFAGKPCVVMLHGLSSNHTTWLRMIEELHNREYNSISLDLRGHGYSDKTVLKSLYNWERFARDVKAVLETENVKKCVMVGYSFGGVITQEFLGQFPDSVSGAILISSNHASPLRHWGIEFLAPIGRAVLNFVSYVFHLQKRKNFEYYEHGKAFGYWDSVFDGFGTMPASVNLWMLALYGAFDYSAVLQGLRIPIYIVRAKSDPFLSMKEAENMGKLIRESKLIISNNPSHFVASQAQDEVMKIILDFLKQYEDRDL
jgi:pimeloyl-ACP methyl ester carboxylesterase